MFSKDFLPHSHISDFPRGFTVQAYEALDSADRHRLMDIVPPQQTPTAGWLDLHRLFQHEEFSYNAGEGDRFYIGHCDGEPVGHKDDRHVLLTASTRSGKGVSTILPNLIFYRGSLLCLDPKGELSRKTARRRASGGQSVDEAGKTVNYAGLGQDVRILDPFGITGDPVREFRAYYNPFEDILTPDAESLEENADLVADAIVVAEPGPDSHWNDTAKALIAGIILHIATYPVYNPDLNADLRQKITQGKERDPRNLITAYRLLMEGCVPRWPHGEVYQPDPEKDPLSGLTGLFQEMTLNPNENVRFAAIDIASKPTNEQGSVISTARRHMKFLSSKAMKDALSPGPLTKDNPVSLKDLKTNPKGLTIYLCLPSIRLATHRAFFRLFVNLAFAAIEELGEAVQPAIRDEHGQPIKTLFLLDEFHVMGPMRIITTAAPLFASYGCQIAFFLQDLSQLKTLYGDGYQSILGNCGTLMFWNNTDPFTQTVIETLLGKTSIVANRYGSISLDALAKGGQSDSRSFETHPLLTGEEVRRHFARNRDNVLVITPEERPIVLRRIRSYEPSSTGGLRHLYDYRG